MSALRGELFKSINDARAAHARLTTAEHEAGQLKRDQLNMFAEEKALICELKVLKATVDEQRNAISVREQKISDLTSCLDDKETIVQGLQEDARLRQEDIRALMSSQQDLEKERSALIASVSDLKETEQEHRDAQHELEAECKSLQRNLIKAEQTIERMETDFGVKNKDFESLERDFNTKQKDIDSTEQKLDSLQEKFDQLEVETGRLAGKTRSACFI